MCDPCCLPLCGPSPCGPCFPSCCPEPSCCPSPCDPCYPPSCDPCCPPSCDPCCPPSCGPCGPCGPCDPCCPPACPPKRCRSRELRSSVLITNCECIKRNGLQLDCPRSECRGRPMCATKPIPICCPSKYMWRYANVTMGKPSYIVPKKPCCPKKPNCNPCALTC